MPKWHKRLGSRTLFICLAIAAGLLASMGRQANAQEHIDISGEWTATLKGDIPTTCLLSLAPSNSQLSAVIDCAGFGSGSFTGAIDPATGDFSLNGTLMLTPVEIEGGASDDGNTITGTWEALGALSGTFSGSRGVESASKVDLVGSWRVDFAGDASSTCAATIEQSGSDVVAAVECEGSGPSTLTGTIGALGIAMDGSPFGYPMKIVARSLDDGNAFGGSWHDPGGGASGVVLGMRNVEHAGDFDLSGDWTVNLTGGFALSCTSAIRQTGSDLYSAVDCGFVGPGTLTGSIDPATGSFRLSGNVFGQVVLLGVVSPDNAAVSGAWVAFDMGLSGTLSGPRVSETPTFIDLSGDWSIILDGALADDCAGHFSQSREHLEVNVDCAELGNGSWEGYVHPLAGRLSLHGALGTLDVLLQGRAPTDSESIEGAWEAGDLGTYGCFAGVRDGTPAPTSCDVPDHDPRVQLSGRGGSPPEDGFVTGGAESDVAALSTGPRGASGEGTRSSLWALAGLGASLLALGIWRLRLRR